MILSAIYAWCRWGVATWGFSPLIQLGQTSLLVYWDHIEFVYGSRLRIRPDHANSIPAHKAGLPVLEIFSQAEGATPVTPFSVIPFQVSLALVNVAKSP